MRKILASAVLGVAVLGTSLPMMNGCAVGRALYGETEAEIFVGVSQDFTITVDTLTALYAAGKINEETWNTVILPLIEEGNKFLDLWAAALDRGDSVGATEYRQAVRSLVVRLSVYLITEG